METWQELKQTFDIDIFELIDELFKNQEVQNAAIEFNQSQLQDGEDALGKRIITIGGSPYRPFTVTMRRKKGLPTNKVTLFYSGEFYKTFYVQILKDGYEIKADFQKEDGSILDNFTSDYDFLGLQDDKLQTFVFQEILLGLNQLIRKRYNL